MRRVKLSLEEDLPLGWDPNTQKIQKNAIYYIIMTKHKMLILGVVSFIKLQNNT